MAVYRSAMFEEKGLRTQFLVFGKPLTRYLGQAIEQTRIAGSTDNFNSWFGTWYFKHFRRYVPVRPGPQRSIDWERVLEAVGKKNFERFDHLVIDEGQDFPKPFYWVMRGLADRNCRTGRAR